MANDLHWMDNSDPNVAVAGRYAPHINRPRISAETIVKLFTLKAKLEGKSVNIVRESQEFEEKNV